MLGDYLVLANPSRAGSESALDHALAQHGWQVALDRPTIRVLRRGSGDPKVEALGPSGALIGDVFVGRRPVGRPVELRDAAVLTVCRRLLRETWGRYILISVDGDEVSIFRDPSGARECLQWEAAGFVVVTSSRLEHLPPQLHPALSLDWNTVAGFLTDAASVGANLALQGVRVLHAGELLRAGGRQARCEQLWSPASVARRPALPDAAARAALVAEVEACVAAFAEDGFPGLAEVSGGLDSAIVASVLAKTRGQNVRVWLNNRSAHPRGDERVYARAVAQRSGFTLTEVLKSSEPLDGTAWHELLGGWRPPVTALDVGRDRALADLCRDQGLRRIFTGQGGDVVFFQEPTPLIFADYLRGGGAWCGAPAMAESLAGWMRRSAWDVIQRGVRGAVRARPMRFASPAILRRDGLQSRPAAHPWLDDIADLPPAKQLQVYGLVACQTLHGESLRSRYSQVIHPLLSQPIVELCLRLSTVQLTQGRRDRALAREAFAGIAPDLVLNRQAKGELNRFYGQLVAASLDFLRPRLLDGVLVSKGVLDRQALEAALDIDDLICRGDYAVILQAALIETWAADWDSRLKAV